MGSFPSHCQVSKVLTWVVNHNFQLVILIQKVFSTLNGVDWVGNSKFILSSLMTSEASRVVNLMSIEWVWWQFSLCMENKRGKFYHMLEQMLRSIKTTKQQLNRTQEKRQKFNLAQLYGLRPRAKEEERFTTSKLSYKFLVENTQTLAQNTPNLPRSGSLFLLIFRSEHTWTVGAGACQEYKP